MSQFPKISVVLPTIGRSESLNLCLQSLEAQTFKDFEIIQVTDEGPLAKIRNKGAKLAKGIILTFIDDDVFADSGWLQGINDIFESRPTIGGASGPAIIQDVFKKQRDIFKFKYFKLFYDKFFCDGKERLPGHIFKSGAWSTGASEENNYEGEVDFLEACNMSFRRELFEYVGGFDENFKGIGDWSEPDLSYRIRGLGRPLWFSQRIRLEHRPSRSGAYGKRSAQAKLRLDNYEFFSKRWIRPHWKHYLYKLFVRSYYAIKSIK